MEFNTAYYKIYSHVYLQLDGKLNATLNFYCLPSRYSHCCAKKKNKRETKTIFFCFRLLIFRIFFFLLLPFVFVLQKLLHQLEYLSIADMGLIPYELLVPLGQLRHLNLSGNHLVNVSMQIIYPVNGLEVFVCVCV